MSRLYGTKYNEERWKVELLSDKNYKTYKLIDKEEMEIYKFYSIIGFEQISDNEFLVFKRSFGDNFEIVRCILEKSKINNIYSHKFSKDFEFISDDRIAFIDCAKTGRYMLSGIYSISENKELEEAKWLRWMGFELKDNVILVEDRISCYALGDDRIVFTVNPDTLEPNSDVYSSFRDSYIKVDSKEDYKEFKLAEQRYINYVSDYYFEQKANALENATKRILKKENN